MKNLSMFNSAAAQPRVPKLSPYYLALFFVVLMAGVTTLSLLVFSKQSLRLDEAQSIWQSARSPLGVLYIISQDVHVPLYGMILHFWQLFFGTGVAIGRTLSLLFFLASLPAMYALGKAAYSKQVGVFATIMLACSPFLNWYAAEMRMYSLLLLLTILNQYLFVKLFQQNEPGKKPTPLLWTAFTAVSVLGVYTHYFFWLVLAAEAVFFLSKIDNFKFGNLKKFSVVASTIVAAILPWLWYVYSNTSSASQNPNLIQPNSHDLFNVLYQFVVGFQNDYLNTILISFWPLSVLLAFFGLRKKKGSHPLTFFFLIAFLVPITLAFVLSVSVKPVFLSRYLIIVVPALYVALSWYLTTFETRVSRVLKLGLVCLMLVTLYHEGMSPHTPTKEHYREASDYITAHAKPEDTIVLSAPFTIYPFEYYYKGPLTIATLPIWDKYETGAIPPFSADTLPAEATKVTDNHGRVWLLLSYNQGYENTVFRYFETHFAEVEHKQFSPGLTLYVYQISY